MKDKLVNDLWERSRSGSHAGRGFRYQDAVATELAVLAWRGELSLRRIVPEGVEDISLELDSHWLHLQAKSRREHRGKFALPELLKAWRHLAERLVRDPAARAGLVLEAALPGTRPGLEQSLAEVAPDDVKAAIAKAVREVITPKDFLSRAYVIVMPSPTDAALRLLAETLGRPPSACVAHEAILRSTLGALADENGVRTETDAASLTATDLARLIDDVTESTDPSALEEAVRTGIAEIADFTTAVADEEFFTGVDVVAGHVVAGLPLSRPEVDLLLDGLTRQRLALAVGPSGAGKSALIWLAAYATRHAVRWYRVRRLRDADVPSLVRLVKGQRAAPLGFVIDDLGRDDRSGFDLLVEESRNYPNVQILAACRQEDVFVVRTAIAAVQVRPTLEPELAERIWAALHDTAATTWLAWREPYEQSEGLLLEYGHLLTQGTRLAETANAQVDRRLREHRDLEINLLSLVSTADTFGAELELARLVEELGVGAVDMRTALVRLVDEHLVHERDGLLGGLHEVRSRHLMEALHRVPPPMLSETVARVIDLVIGFSLQPFLTRVLLANIVPDEVIIDALTARLNRDHDLPALAAALHALRLVGFRRNAARWRVIFDEEEAPPSDVGIVSFLALQDGYDDMFPESVRRACGRIRELERLDLRDDLLPRIHDAVSAALATVSDLPSALTVLAALGEAGESVDVGPSPLARLAGMASLAEIRTLLEAAYAASPQLAIGIAEELGGSTALLDRLQREQSWVRNARVGVNVEGRTTAQADYAYVAESAQPDAHAAVVDLAYYLSALTPGAEVAVCRAVDATGETAGFKGTPIADKRIDRANLPNKAAVAWNRARGRAAIAAVAASTSTEYAIAARELVVMSKRVVREIGETWARGKRPTKQLIAEALALAEAANRLRPPPIAIETLGPLDEGDLPTTEPATFVARLVANNLLPRLFSGERVAPVIPQIVEQVDKIPTLDIWRLLEDPPTADVAGLRRGLIDLHAVVAEQAAPNGARAAVTVAGRRGLSSAASAARREADRRRRFSLDKLERELSGRGYGARVLRREIEPDSYKWPADDVLVLVQVATIFEWQSNLEAIADLCRSWLDDRSSFVMAPVRGGRVIASYGVKVVTGIYPDESARLWPNLEFVDETLGDTVRRGLSALHEASGILASISTREVHEDEIATLEAAAQRAREALEDVERLAADRGDRLLLEVRDSFADLGRRVEEEAAALQKGQQVARGIAASFIAGLSGDVDDVFATQIGMLAACAEWDVDPQGAWERFEHESEDAP